MIKTPDDDHSSYFFVVVNRFNTRDTRNCLLYLFYFTFTVKVHSQRYFAFLEKN
ncbi:hypothetical protein HanPSC8_Chr03g0087701 [Helianthus annuus]|nr:hypothetical protein HanPSC8_Chr03g0087701 [Helianthus annuus]